MKLFPTILSAVVLAASVASAADTITVRTLTFDDITKRSGTYLFPPPQRYEKVLMEMTLKCDPRTTQDRFDCGEWDYLTYTFITDSTGQFDSTRLEAVNYRVRGITPDSFPYTTTPVPLLRRYRVVGASRRSQVETQITRIGSGGASLATVFTAAGGRARWIWTASELAAAGMTAGTIQGLELTSRTAQASQISALRIMMNQQTNAQPPSRLVDSGFTTVLLNNVTLVEGRNQLAFGTPFSWDGTSDIIVDIACASASVPVQLLADPSPVAGTTADESRWAYAFTGNDMIELHADVGNALSTGVTIVFWAWGNQQKLPKASSVFEAWDDQGRRVLNAHLPWDNARVYWDAGRDASSGAFDRIETDLPESAYEGRWNHWAFVKDATTGIMRIYLNGEVFFEGNGKTRDMTGIRRFIVGAGGAGAFEGYLDEFQVYSRALDGAVIKNWMNRKMTPNHPAFNQLEVYIDAESGNDPFRVVDAGPNNLRLTASGLPTRRQVRLGRLGYLTSQTSARPTMGFEMGSASISPLNAFIELEETGKQESVVLFERPVQPRVYAVNAPDLPGVPTDTVTVYAAGQISKLEENDLEVAPYTVPATAIYRKVVRPYFSPVVVFEIGRYITPYGIGLDLGPKGFKWVYDVTDYAPLLRNNVTLSSGNQQELIDLTFKFITGTPPRDVKQIDQVINNRDASYAEMAAGRLFTPEDIPLSAEATTWRVKTRTTGHRFGEPSNCAEFCQRLHNVSVNGTKRFEWLLWNECGNNPVYPQGGTWQLDRAGWCPGAPVDVYDWEITPFVRPGDRTVNLDYGVESDQWNASQGVWDVAMQLFGYGPINHRVDASVSDIIAPTTWEFYSRLNPICGEPIIVIRNNGSDTLRSATITYGIDGTSTVDYAWTGRLAFMESDTVVLPPLPASMTSGQHTFKVEILRPNGTVDEYAQNNSMTSNLVMSPAYYRDFTLSLRTNRQASQQGLQWELRKVGGTRIAAANNLRSEAQLDTTLRLEDGCYEFRFVNPSGYGLDLWFIRDQLGTGNLEFRSRGITTFRFNPDFGTTAWQQFRVAPAPTLKAIEDTVRLGNAEIGQEITGVVRLTPDEGVPVSISAFTVQSTRNVFTIKSFSKDTTGGLVLQPNDTLDIVVAYKRDNAGANNGSLRVQSNDPRRPQYSVRLVASAGQNTSVEADVPADDFVRVIPNPVTATGDVVLTLGDRFASDVTVEVHSLLGTAVATLARGPLAGSEVRLPLPTDLPAGLYTVVVRAGSLVRSTTFVMQR